MSETTETIKVKCISVKQPFATLIITGKKPLEIRTWRTPHRGLLAIASSAQPKMEGLPTGVLVGLVEVQDVRPMVKGDAKKAHTDFNEAALSWVLKNPFMVIEEEQKIPVKGKLGIYEIEIPVSLWEEYEEWREEEGMALIEAMPQNNEQ